MLSSFAAASVQRGMSGAVGLGPAGCSSNAAQQRAVVERGVEIRDATLRLAGLSTLDDIFTVLGQTFAADECQRAQIWLHSSFLSERQMESLDGRLDDVLVQTWTPSE